MNEVSTVSTLFLSLLPTGDGALYAGWAADVEATAIKLPEYLEAETHVPVPGIQDRWVMLLRFGGQAGIAAWLASPERAALLGRVEALAPLEQVVTGPGSTKKPVTVLVNTRVKPEDEASFKTWQAEIAKTQRAFPGYIDGKLLGPVPGVSDVWTTVMRFDSDEHVDNWLKSKERQESMSKVDAKLRGDAPRKIVADLGGWFQVKSTEEPPSNWKQALCVLLALYPAVIGLSFLNVPAHLMSTPPFALAMLINNILSMILLTWFIMPHLTGALRFWLQPPADQPQSTETVTTVAVIGVILAQLLIFLKLT